MLLMKTPVSLDFLRAALLAAVVSCGVLFPAPALSRGRENIEAQLIASNLRTYRESLQIRLMGGAGRKDLAMRLPSLENDAPGIAADIKEKDLFSLFVRRTKDSLKAAPSELEVIDAAARAAADFLSINEDPVILKSSLLPERISSRASVRLAPVSSAVRSRLAAVSWEGVDSYMEQRMAALCPVLRTLRKGDRVVLTNLQAAEILPLLPESATVEKLNLPLVRYQKSINLVSHKNGTVSLILSDFRSRAYLTHFLLMAQKYLLRTNAGGPDVYRAETLSAYEPAYLELKDFIIANRRRFENVTALVFGYAPAFREGWKQYSEDSVRPGKETWGADFYEIPGKGRVAVFSGDAGTYGESLGRQTAGALALLPGVKLVFFGGSGGALRSMTPYSLFFPDAIVVPGGVPVENILSDGASGGLHASVDSPLEEDPQFLSRMAADSEASVDMEVAGLAEAVRAAGAGFGAAILITDYPLPRGIFGGIELGYQDFQAKRPARAHFAEVVLNRLILGRPVLAHEIESYSGKTTAELSDENIRAYRKKLGPLTGQEEELAKKIKALKFEPVIRMSPGRLWWFAEDGTLLSTRKVEEVKKTKTAPYTPYFEESIYGAYDYIFASFEPGNGRADYGSVAVKLRPRVLARTWGTLFSAWASGKRLGDANPGIQPAELLKQTRKTYAGCVLRPSDYMEAVSLRVIEFVRAAPGELRTRVFNARDGPQLWVIMEPLNVARLELKIKGFLDLDEVDRILTGKDVSADLVKRLRDKSIPVENF
jgi:hypothetical protein